MKKTIFTVMAFTAFSSAIYAQTPDIKIGAKAGVNFSNVSGADEDTKMKTGFHVGGLVEIFINEKFSIQPELLYSTQGAKGDNTETVSMGGSTIVTKAKETLKLDYINVPIMAKYYVMEGLSVQAGPQIGFLIKGETDIEASATIDGVAIDIPGANIDETVDIKSELNKVDFGLNFGVGYELPMGVFFDARYNLGLNKIPKEKEMGDYKNQVIQVSVGYKF